MTKKLLSLLLLTLLCSIGNVWGTDLCSATLNGIDATANTTGVSQTDCTMKWSGVSVSSGDIVTISSSTYHKFSSSSSYVQLILNSGSFQAGDVLTVTACSNAGSGKTKDIQFSLNSDSGNKSSVKAAAGDAVTNIEYTLVAADIESDGSIKIFRAGNTNIRFGSFSVTGSRAATYTITLDDNGGTKDGSATATAGSNKLTSISAPTWAGKGVVGYYQEAGCTHLIADAAGNLQASTDYTDANGKWTSTSNQTLYTKWLSANNATFSEGNYTIGGSALDLSTLFTSSSDGAVTYSIKDANGTGAAIAGSSFIATTAGTATVTATQAATATYAPATLDATITVVNNPLGSHTLTWIVKTGINQTTLAMSSKSSSSAYLDNLKSITLEGLAVRDGGGKDNSSPKIETPATETSTKYTYVTFKVASGYKFILNKVTTKLVAVSHSKTVKCEISDNAGGTTQSLSYNQSSNSDPGAEHDFSFTSSNMYSGTVTVKLYIWGSNADDYRMGKPLTISGIVVRETPEVISINGTAKYATYHNYSNAYVMPAGLEGITISGISGSTLALSDPATYKAGDIVPAHEPLLLHAPEISSNTNFNLYLTYTATSPLAANKLKGLAEDGETTGAGEGGKYYRLTWDGSDVSTLGFEWGAANGAAFEIGADKAYLALNSSSALAAPSYLRLVEDENNATDIQSLEANDNAIKFIQNGQLLILRDGITYDALGRVVK